MPGHSCCVDVCKNKTTNVKSEEESIIFHMFPRNKELRDEWMRRCNKRKRINPQLSRICNKHFANDAYKDEIKARIMNTYPRKLKETAVPTLLLSAEINITDNSSGSACPEDPCKKNKLETNKEANEIVKKKVDEVKLNIIKSKFIPIAIRKDENVFGGNFITTTNGKDVVLERRLETVIKANETLKIKLDEVTQENFMLSKKIFEFSKQVDEVTQKNLDLSNTLNENLSKVGYYKQTISVLHNKVALLQSTNVSLQRQLVQNGVCVKRKADEDQLETKRIQIEEVMIKCENTDSP